MSAKPLQRLLVFLPPRQALLEGGGRGYPSAATVVGYAGIDASRQVAAVGEAPLSLVPKAAAVDLIFDAADVFTAPIDAPRMPDARLRQALPSLVEERLLSDAADCHLAHAVESVAESSLRVAVAALEHVTLTRALEAATEAGLRPRAAYSALYTIPPPTADVLSIRVERGRGTARTGAHAGVAFDVEDEPPAALTVALQQLGAGRIHVYGNDAARLAPWTVHMGIELVDLKADLDVPSLAGAVNLLQGRFAPSGRLGMPAIAALARGRTVKPLLAWAAVWFAVFVIGLNAYRWRLESEAHTLRASMQNAFRSAFPSEAFIEPMSQTQRHLRELRARAGQSSPDDFSVLNAQAAQLLADAPVGAVAGLEYHDGALTLKFKSGIASSPSFQNALRARAMQQGMDVHFEGDGSVRAVPVAP